MEKTKLVIGFLLLCVGFSHAQMTYFVPFKDKAGTPFQLSQPESFLTAKSIANRSKQNISLSQDDLPVNPAYTMQVHSIGVKVLYTSKWFNGVVVEANSAQLISLKNLSCVTASGVKVIKTKASNKEIQEGKRTHKTKQNAKNNDFTESFLFNKTDYGYSYTQNQMIGADEMHKRGFWGEGITIAIFDSGFSDADQQTYFKHLFENGQIASTYDFVRSEKSVFEDDDHGRMVLSCIAAFEKGKIVGTAPKARFYLFRTEDTDSEFVVEEYNWLKAAETADSLGVHIISSSLGYNKFDDPSSSYTIENLDGKTGVSTRAAQMAAQRGIVVVSSAGNEGGSAWNKISVPADAASILSIGSVGSNGTLSYFSSRGNTADGRIKPDVLAMGSSSTVGGNNSSVSSASGTSFSAPITTGLVAGFWQANPQLSAIQVTEYMRRSGSQYAHPDPNYGYGLVNFQRADYLAKKETTPDGIMTNQDPNGIRLYPNPYARQAKPSAMPKLAWGNSYRNKNITLKLYDNNAKMVWHKKVRNVDKETVLEGVEQLASGEYILVISPNLDKNPSLRLVIE